MTGTAKPIQNQYSWTNLSSLLYVEQPVGVGYSLGTPNAKVAYLSFMIRLMTLKCILQSETDVASQLVGFLQQFLGIFSELKGKNFYLTGESVSILLPRVC
jgi:carboxypeptidase D